MMPHHLKTFSISREPNETRKHQVQLTNDNVTMTRQPNFKLPWVLCALALLSMQVRLHAQAPILRGQVVLVDENGIATPAPAGVEITVADTGATDRTDAKGLFRIPLVSALQPGGLITLDVAKPGWAVWQPEEGKTPLPQGLLTVKLLPKGSKKFWTDHFIQTFIETTAEKAKHQVKPSASETPKPIDFAPLIRDWATKYGFTPEEAKAQIEKWVAEVEEAQQDFYKLGLAAFAEHNFRKAGDLLSQAGQNSEQRLQIVQKQQAQLDAKRLDLVLETVRNYEKAGDARYSDYAFAGALSSYQKALSFIDRASQPELWAQLHVEIGKASAGLGSEAEGAAIRNLLSQSVTEYRSALEVYTRTQFPQQWATIQHDMGEVLGYEGTRSSAEEDLQFLTQAVAAYRLALEVRTRERSPQDWAASQNGLGVALFGLWRLNPETEAPMLTQAIASYRAALQVRTRQQSPQDWAATENNLGIALAAQGARYGDGQLLEQAIAAYHSSLEVRTLQLSPELWAATQINLGTTLNAQAARTDGGDSCRLLAQAADAYRAAILGATRQKFPQMWGAAQQALASDLEQQSACSDRPQALQLQAQAVAAYRAALEVYTRERLPEDWAATEYNLGLSLVRQILLAAERDQAPLAEQAIAAYRLALEVYTRAQFPSDWAQTQGHLARLYTSLGQWPEAAESYRNVLQVNPTYEDPARALSFIYHERTFDFASALTLHQDWLKTHPNDRTAQLALAQALFTMSRFAEAHAQLIQIENKSDPPSSTAFVVLALDIASLVAQHQVETVPAKLQELITSISSQPAGFKLEWNWDGTLHFIQTEANLAPSRLWLQTFVQALQGETRDSILAALRPAAQNLPVTAAP